MEKNQLKVEQVPINVLKASIYNPRRWSDKAIEDLTESIERFGLVDALLVNKAPKRKDIVIGGHFRLHIAKKLGYKKVPVIYLDISDEEKEKELNLRLNKNTGDWDLEVLAKFDKGLLEEVGFSSEDMDDIFNIEVEPETFDLEKELKKIGIDEVQIKKGDIWQLGEHRIMCGDSTIEEDVMKLYGENKCNLVLTDPPYDLAYLHGRRAKGKDVTGFGAKKNRRYLETEELPDDFTEKWMANVAKVQEEDFSIIVYELWKNIRTIWGAMEQHWKVKNMIVWHVPNRHQGFAAKHKFFSKHDIAMVGSSMEKEKLNLEVEELIFQEQYETALYAISGDPHWEGYEKGKKIQPTDFIQHKASDESQSGQGVIFGTKPVDILIPYIKVLTKRGDIVGESFGGSGSTLIASEMMGRRCFLMEKSPVYAEVIKARWEKLTGKKGVLLNE